jgi:hypothetical protein
LQHLCATIAKQVDEKRQLSGFGHSDDLALQQAGIRHVNSTVRQAGAEKGIW